MIGEVPVITTFVPDLVNHLHKVRVLLHDNTYKQIAGKERIEWETVTWLDDMIYRCDYCTLILLMQAPSGLSPDH